MKTTHFRLAVFASLMELLQRPLMMGGVLAAQCNGIQQNVDFFGADVANVKADKSDKCCDLCAANSDCKAWTWSGYNGGTCWLKRATGYTVKQGETGKVSGLLATATTTPPPSGRSCSIQLQGIDFFGSDVANSPGQANQCCDLCKANSSCKRWTWTNFNGGTCWLKDTGNGRTQSSPGALSGVVYEGNNKCLAVFTDIDFAGGDLSNTPNTPSGECCNKCSATPNCKFWTWSNYQGGTCWLKTSTGTPKASPGAVSSYLTGSTDPVTTTPPAQTTTPASTTTPPAQTTTPVTTTTTPPPANLICYTGSCLKGNYQPNGWANAGQTDTPPCWKNEGSYWSCFDYANGQCPWGGMEDCGRAPRKLCENFGRYCGGFCYNPARMHCCFNPLTGDKQPMFNYVDGQFNNACQPPRQRQY